MLCTSCLFSFVVVVFLFFLRFKPSLLSLLSCACPRSQQEEVSCQLDEVKIEIPQNDVTLHTAVPLCFRAGSRMWRRLCSWRSWLCPRALNVVQLSEKIKLFYQSSVSLPSHKTWQYVGVKMGSTWLLTWLIRSRRSSWMSSMLWGKVMWNPCPAVCSLSSTSSCFLFHSNMFQ